MASVVLPGAAFARRKLVIATVAAGTTWQRLYETRFLDPLGYGPGLSRFSDPTGQAFGVIYLGASLRVSFVETVLRDRSDGRGAECLIDQSELDRRSVATIRPKVGLKLVDLTGNGGLRMGVPSDVIGARDQTLSRQWSVAFHDHPDKPDGILYPSRLNEERCIAIYERAAGTLKITTSQRLMDCDVALAALIEELELGII